MERINQEIRKKIIKSMTEVNEGRIISTQELKEIMEDIDRKSKGKSWAQITAPLRKAAKKSKFKESDVDALIHRVRRENRNKV